MIVGIGYDDGRATWWPRSMAKTIRNGRYEETIRQQGFLHQIRIEAEGYLPAESRTFRPYAPDRGEVTYDFKLSKAPPLNGTVIGLTGDPLADVDVYLATERINIAERKANFVGESPTARTDAAGHFEFPAEIEPYCLVVVHQQGIGMVTEKEFESSQRISIQPWTARNQTLQIIRRSAPGQSVDFPKKFP